MESFKSSIFKDKALKALSGQWKPSVIVSLVTMLIIGGSIALQHVSVLLYYAVFWLFGSIVSIGCAYVFLDLYRDKKEPRVCRSLYSFSTIRTYCYLLYSGANVYYIMVVAFVCSGNNKGIILLNVLFYIEGPSGTISGRSHKRKYALDERS